MAERLLCFRRVFKLSLFDGKCTPTTPTEKTFNLTAISTFVRDFENTTVITFCYTSEQTDLFSFITFSLNKWVVRSAEYRTKGASLIRSIHL